jgi:hypothetical protein
MERLQLVSGGGRDESDEARERAVLRSALAWFRRNVPRVPSGDLRTWLSRAQQTVQSVARAWGVHEHPQPDEALEEAQCGDR